MVRSPKGGEQAILRIPAMSVLDRHRSIVYTGSNNSSEEVIPMITAGIKEAREHLTEYLSMVQKGEEIIISKRNEPIAIIKPIKKKAKRRLESHKELRTSIIVKGKPLSDIVAEARKEAVY